MTSIHTLNRIIADAASAPSAHNTQPWSPRMIGDGEAVELRVARTRTLPASDPTGRDTLLGLGAWLEAFSVSAAAHRVDFDVELLPALADPEASCDEPSAADETPAVSAGVRSARVLVPAATWSAPAARVETEPSRAWSCAFASVSRVVRSSVTGAKVAAIAAIWSAS